MDRSSWEVKGFSHEASGIRVKYERASWGGTQVQPDLSSGLRKFSGMGRKGLKATHHSSHADGWI